MNDAQDTHCEASLYEKIGGEFTLNAAVDRFYEKIENEKRLAVFFENVNLLRQVEKQRAFMRMVMGATDTYKGKSLRDAHRPLLKKGLNDKHIDIFVGHFADTLTELGVADTLVKEVVARANSFRDDILNR